MEIVTCVAPVNIAVIKYWGKRDEDLILPINDSISCTISMDHMHSKTTVMASSKFKENKIWLNGKEEPYDNPRLKNCLHEIRSMVADENAEIFKWNLHICSENNFPTAAGLASSAAGYACLVTALAKLYKIKSDLSLIARRGSGSACRSIYGGWVQWHMGQLPTGVDSIATELYPVDHWTDMRVLILVVNDKGKKYPSTVGMKQSVLTSELLKYRASTIVPQRIKKMQTAIQEKKFHDFAVLTMADSNQFHAVCLDTMPPCVYMNDVSNAIVQMVHAFNDLDKDNYKLAYTFDAGPNAVLFLLERDVPIVLQMINEYFPSDLPQAEYIKGIQVDLPVTKNILQLDFPKQAPNLLKYIISTKAGEAPKLINNPYNHLLDEEGNPK